VRHVRFVKDNKTLRMHGTRLIIHIGRLPPPLPLEGKLSANSILDKAEEVKLDREIIGPESVALRGDELFTGIVGGELIRIKDGKVKTIVRTGSSCGTHQYCK